MPRDLQHEMAATIGPRGKIIEPTFEAFVAANRDEAEKIGRLVLADALDGFAPGGRRDQLIKLALRRWRKCPALAAAIRADLFINRAVRSGTKLPHDCWDDLKHCVNAAYADVFVTRDQRLTEVFREIRPGPRISSTEDFLSELGPSS